MDNLQKSMNTYNKWLSRRCDAFEDRNRNTPIAQFGNSMVAHGEDFEQDSEFGTLLCSVGQANQRIAELQAGYLNHANSAWAEHLERNVAMMKEYQVCHCQLASHQPKLTWSTERPQEA